MWIDCGLPIKRLSRTSSKNINTYIYINTVAVADACGSFGYRANSDGCWRLTSTGCEEEGLISHDGVRKKTERARGPLLSNQIHNVQETDQRKPWKSRL
jgi:hypothetical protein